MCTVLPLLRNDLVRCFRYGARLVRDALAFWARDRANAKDENFGIRAKRELSISEHV